MLIISRGFQWEQNKILSQPFLYHFEWWHSTCLDSWVFFLQKSDSSVLSWVKRSGIDFCFCLFMGWLCVILTGIQIKKETSPATLCVYSTVSSQIKSLQLSVFGIWSTYWGYSEAKVRKQQCDGDSTRWGMPYLLYLVRLFS